MSGLIPSPTKTEHHFLFAPEEATIRSASGQGSLKAVSSIGIFGHASWTITEVGHWSYNMWRTVKIVKCTMCFWQQLVLTIGTVEIHIYTLYIGACPSCTYFLNMYYVCRNGMIFSVYDFPSSKTKTRWAVQPSAPGLMLTVTVDFSPWSWMHWPYVVKWIHTWQLLP